MKSWQLYLLPLKVKIFSPTSLSDIKSKLGRWDALQLHPIASKSYCIYCIEYILYSFDSLKLSVCDNIFKGSGYFPLSKTMKNLTSLIHASSLNEYYGLMTSNFFFQKEALAISHQSKRGEKLILQ